MCICMYESRQHCPHCRCVGLHLRSLDTRRVDSALMKGQKVRSPKKKLKNWKTNGSKRVCICARSAFLFAFYL